MKTTIYWAMPAAWKIQQDTKSFPIYKAPESLSLENWIDLNLNTQQRSKALQLQQSPFFSFYLGHNCYKQK